MNAPSGLRPLVEKALDRVSGLGWHLQVFSNLAEVAGLEDLVMRAPVPVVIDHVAGAKPDLGVGRKALPLCCG